MSHIVIISGSSQADSQSLRIAKYIQKTLKDGQNSADIIDLHQDWLPIFKSQPADNWSKIKPKLELASSYVWIIPEWNGGANPSIKNMLLYAGNNLLAHKPVMFIGISAGRGGFYPLMDMRSAGHKDARYVISPDNLVINNCYDKFTTDNKTNEADERLHKHLNYCLSILGLYDQALNSIRQSNHIDHQTYPYSM